MCLHQYNWCYDHQYPRAYHICRRSRSHLQHLCHHITVPLSHSSSHCRLFEANLLQDEGIFNVLASLLSTTYKVYIIAKFAGNRFNILFYKAGIHFLRHHLIRYLKVVHHTQNKLLQAVLHDLQHPLYLTGCRALGIVRKCITSPLWRILESPLSMSELGLEYQRMHSQFLLWSSGPSMVMPCQCSQKQCIK